MKTNPPEALWERVARGAADECWTWLGATTGSGYGAISVGGRDVATHRLAYELAHGPIPEGLWVLHHCDNPPCCNPRHLYPGTGSDNQRDSVARGRRPSRAGELHPRSKLTNAEREEIRRRRTAGERNCDLAAEFGVSRPTITRLQEVAA